MALVRLGTGLLHRRYYVLVPDSIPLRPADRFIKNSRLTGEMRVVVCMLHLRSAAPPIVLPAPPMPS